MFEGSFYVILNFEGNSILARGIGRLHPVPSDSYMRNVIRDFLGGVEFETPIQSLDLVSPQLTSPGIVFAAGEAGYFEEAWLLEEVPGVSEGQGSAVFEEHEFFAEAESFVTAMCYHDHVALVLFEEVFHVFLEGVLEVAVEGGEWFVEEDRLWFSDHHSCEGYSLLLTAGELGWVAVFESVEVVSLNKVCYFGILNSFFSAETAFDVVLYCHGREKGIVLKKVADPSLLWFEIDLFFRVKHSSSVDDDLSLVRFLDSGDAAQGHALAASGCSEDPCCGAFAVECCFQRKSLKAFFYFYMDGH